LNALAAHLLDASADYRDIISNAGSGHVLPAFYTRSRGIVPFPFVDVPSRQKRHRMTRADKLGERRGLRRKRLFWYFCPNRLGGHGQSQVHDFLEQLPKFVGVR